MRINYSEDEDFPGQFGLWQANCVRAIKGHAGRAALQELREALLALPRKRLIAGEFEKDGDVCTIGALVRYKGIHPSADPESEMELIGVECGMPRLVAWKIVELTDLELDRRWDGFNSVKITPEERYSAVMKWIEQNLSSD